MSGLFQGGRYQSEGSACPLVDQEQTSTDHQRKRTQSVAWWTWIRFPRKPTTADYCFGSSANASSWRQGQSDRRRWFL